ncbi:MAG: site-2 protease family protein [Candidatus Pacebacteria bacterium]|nr:site-2 protease family protein [Candidatus Paceibacterota bacterium]
MTIIIFILILLLLVLIHEAGHFFAAKISKVKVEEFAFGFPPKIYSFKKGETNYVINALPIGGYVKIYGENGEDDKDEKKKSFVNKSPLIKIFILSAGVIMNILLAYVLITISLYGTSNFQVDSNTTEYQTFLKDGRIKDEYLVVASVLERSPAKNSGLEIGDRVNSIYLNQEDKEGKILLYKNLSLDDSSENITKSIVENSNDIQGGFGDSVTIVYKNKSGLATTTIAGVYGLEGSKDKKLLGLSFVKFARVNLKPSEAFYIGFLKTKEALSGTLTGFWDLISNLFKNGKVSENISGPVGIFNMIGGASHLGFDYLLLFAAILSISLAVFNILPFPALDGGRILFVLIEWVTGKKISEKWQGILNGAGFIFLILLMVVISIRDLIHLIK